MIYPVATQNYMAAQLSRNPIVINIDAADPVAIPARSGLRYYCQIQIPESYLSAAYKTLVRLEAAEQPAVSAGAGKLYQGAFFEIQNQLDPLLERTAPTFNQARISVADRAVMPYYCVLTVQNNDVDVSSTTLPVSYVVKAGIDEVDYNAYRNEFFTTFIGGGRRFLTWAENRKVLQPDQPEFLYFLTNFSPAPSQIRVVCQATFADGTEAETLPLSLDNIAPFTVYCVPVGPKALGLDLAAGELLSYQVFLIDQNSQRISEIREYVMDQEYRRNVRFVVFANSLGGFDTMALIGEGEELVKYQRSISDRFQGWEFLPSYSERVINEVSGRRELTVATGWLSKEGGRYLEELYLSTEVYLVTDRALVPLLPASDSLRPAVDDEDLLGRTLQFTFSNDQANYSDLPNPAGLFTRPTAWRPKASACLLDANGRRTGKRQATVLEKYYTDDNKKVVGVSLKSNVPGTDGYIPPITSADCSTTPYLNSLISKPGTFSRRDCPPPQTGGPALIVVAAGTFGSEISLADAQAKAETEWNRINTQLYADANGTCILAAETYAFAVPANCWHYRAAVADSVALYWNVVNDPQNRTPIGNHWSVQSQPGPYVFPINSNDLDFPISYSTGPGWTLLVYGPGGTARRVKVYQDGVLKLNYTVTLNQDGFEQVNLTDAGGASFALINGGKLYITNEAA